VSANVERVLLDVVCVFVVLYGTLGFPDISAINPFMSALNASANETNSDDDSD
jgi:hypothetical protein